MPTAMLVRVCDADFFRASQLIFNTAKTLDSFAMATLAPFYENVQAHYDLSNDFFRLFLGPTMMYTSAYFERDDMTQDEAQEAKIRLAFSKCDLRPGQRLLDIGCGWGTTIIRAVENHGVQGIGITLSGEQATYANEQARHLNGKAEFRLQGW